MIQKFISEVIESQTVFVIEDKDGVAVSQSLLFQNEDGSPVSVICFWSDKDLASQSCVEDWQAYKPQEICLATYIEDYLVQIYNESLIVGLNFNPKMEGLEADPLNIIEHLVSEIKTKNIDLEFEHFKNLQDLEQQLKQLLNS